MNEQSLLYIVLIYLAVIRSSLLALLAMNVVTFSMYGIDKWKAKKSKWRIPEATLLMMAAIGGSIGAWIGVKVWHHKTLHKGGSQRPSESLGGYQFRYGIPAIIIVQLAIIGYILYR